MSYDMDSVTNCTRCKNPFDDHRIGIGITDGGWTEVICHACGNDEIVQNYKKTGELTSRLVMSAVLANEYYEHGGSHIRQPTLSFYEQQKKILVEVYRADSLITRKAKLFELTHWLGEDKLQGYYRRAKTCGHGAETDTFKVMMWGCAGRVLLTIQDKFPQNNPQSKFGGAWITLIFDEDSPTARGGVQGYCATLDEAWDLLEAATNNLPALKPDEEIRLLGT